jgi:hypothetical protein
MDAASIAKNLIGLQKQSFNNFVDTMIIIQDQAEKTNRLWAKQMRISEDAQQFADQWRTALIKGRDDSRKLINESFTSMEDYFAGLEQKESSEKKKPSKK